MAFFVAILVPVLLAVVAEGRTCTENGKTFRTSISYGICKTKAKQPTFPVLSSRYDRDYHGCILGKREGFNEPKELATGSKTEKDGKAYECKSPHQETSLNVEPRIHTRKAKADEYCYVKFGEKEVKVFDGQWHAEGLAVFQCEVSADRTDFVFSPWGCLKRLPGNKEERVAFDTSWVEPAAPGAAGNLLSTQYFCDKDSTDGTHKIKYLKNKKGCEIEDPDNKGQTKLIKLGDPFSYGGVVSKCELAKDALSASLNTWGCVKPANWAGEDTLEFGKGGVWKGEPMDFGPLPFTVYPTYTCEKEDGTVTLNPHSCKVDNDSFGPGCTKVFGELAVVCREEQSDGKKTGTLLTKIVYADKRSKEPEKDCNK